jgi:hypothetical protein
VVEGIVSASDGQLKAAGVKKLLADLKARQFLLNSVYLDAPLLFETRWVMSYLKGPMSNSDIKKLMAAKSTEAVETSAGGQIPSPDRVAEMQGAAGLAPVVAQGIEQLYYLHNVVSERVDFAPWLGAEASLRFFNAQRNIDIVRKIHLRICLDESWSRPEWQTAETTAYGLADCQSDPPADSCYYPLPPSFARLKDLRGIARTLSDYLYHNEQLELFRFKDTDFESNPHEILRDFKVRFNDHLREQKDQAVDKLKEKYQTRQDRLEQKLQKALDRVDKEKGDVRAKTADSLISFGVAVVGAFFGRKTFSAANIGKAATGMRSVGRVAKEKSDVQRAEQDVAEIQNALQELTVTIEEHVNELTNSFHIDNYEMETFAIKPRRSDIFDVRMVLLWEMVVV